MKMAIIEVKDLVKKYKKATTNAVDGVSFEVYEGEFFALLGPNGAGKTTIISVLTTTLSKTSGEMKIGGLDIDKNSSKVRRMVGIIFQNPSLDLNLTAEENIRFHCSLYGLYSFRPLFQLMPKEYKTRVFEMAELLGIKNEIFKPIKTFSGGMKRKLEIVRSLMHKPRVLFLDEPTIGLDPLSRRDLWRYLREMRVKEKTTIFLTTHYLDEAEEVDRVCIINKGKVVQIGEPRVIKGKLLKEELELEAKDRDKLILELNTKKIKYEIRNSGVVIKVHKSEFQRVIKSINTPLSSIKTNVPTLEEAYLSIIGGGENGA